MEKRLLFLIITVISLSLGTANSTEAQTIEIVAGNTLNGAMNGVILGGASMALSNTEDFRPVEIGLGTGILYGLGVGIYDLSQIDSGQQFYISGTFNDGTNSSIIVLLDTFYGVAGGALIASSVALIIKEPILTALQYGTSIGAWAGFGFGLVDAFLLAKGPNFSQKSARVSSDVSGLITYKNASSSLEMGFLSPSVISKKEITGQSIQTSINPTVDLIQLQFDF